MKSTDDRADVPAFMNTQPRLGPRGDFAFPRAESFRLKNGLRVVLAPKADLPLVRLKLALPCGTAADRANAGGVAYLTAHMLERGAGKRSALQFSGALQDLGSTVTAWTDQDHALVLVSSLRRNLEQSLDLLADLLLRPRFTGGELARLKKEVRARVQQRRAQPAQTAHLALKSAVFGEHPYGRALLPAPGSLGGIKPAALQAYHGRCYRPRGAVLVAAGDITAQELRALLEARLSAWSGEAPEPGDPPPPPDRGPRLVLVDRPGATQSVIRVGHLCPPRRSREFAMMELLNTALGGSFTSRLNLNLREKHGFTYGARSQFMLRRERGLFAASASVETEDTAAALTEILAELRGMSARPLTRSELSRARQLLVEEQPGRAETVAGLVEAYADLAANGLPLPSLNRFPDQVKAITSSRAAAAARRLIRADQATIVVAGDVAKLRPALEKAHGPAQVRDPDGAVINKPPTRSRK